MQLLVDKEKLDELMKRRGFRNYRDVAVQAKRRGLPLSEGTIYKMVDEATWTATRMAALCELLGCTPSEIIPNWEGGEEANTHESPQSETVLEGEPA